MLLVKLLKRGLLSAKHYQQCPRLMRGFTAISGTVKLDSVVWEPRNGMDSSKDPIFLYHGKFTTKDIWSPVGQAIADATKRKLYSLDMRNHGGSPYTDSKGMTLQLMTHDLRQFMSDVGSSKGVMVGHSLGGRVMMQMAMYYPELVESLVVFDMGFNIPTKPLSFLYYFDQALLEFVKTLPPEMSLEDGKKQFENLLSMQLKDKTFIDIIVNTLMKEEKTGFKYCFNAPVMYELLWKGKVHHLDVTEPFNGKSLFIYGNSGYVVEDDFVGIETVFPNVKFNYIDVGHFGMWEKPNEFLKVISEFVNL